MAKKNTTSRKSNSKARKNVLERINLHAAGIDIGANFHFVRNLLNRIAPDRLSPIWSFANATTKLLGTELAIGHKAPMVHRP